MRILLITILLSLNIASNVSAQGTPPVELSKMSIATLKTYAKKSLSEGDTYSALAYYKEIVSKSPNDTKSVYQLADLYRGARDYKKAAQMYSKGISQKPDDYPEAYFYLGQMYKAVGSKEEAQGAFNTFQSKSSGAKNLQLRQLVDNEIKGLEDSDDIMGGTLKADVKSVDGDVNKAHFEGNSILVDDNTFLFISKGEVKNIYQEKKGDQKESELFPNRQLYIANKDGENWNTELASDYPSNSMKEITSGAFSYDRKRFYYTQCSDEWDGKTICKLFVSKLSGGSWSEGVQIDSDINQEGSTTTMPATGLHTVDGQEVIYFVSDRKTSVGGKDIWSAIYDKKEDRYYPASNLGREVNTIGDEVTPWYDQENGKLYFSTNGWPTLGGYDIFEIEGVANDFSGVAENIGGHINTTYDELYYSHTMDDTNKGYITSNRPGTTPLLSENCCYDIFEFDVIDECKNKVLAGKVVDEDTRACLTDYNLEFYELNEETNQYDLLETIASAQGCEFRFEDLDCKKSYKAFVRKGEYEPTEIPIDLTDPKDPETPEGVDKYVEIPLRKKPETPEPPALPKFTPKVGELYVLKDVYFDYDKAILKPRSVEVLDDILVTFMNDNPYAIIELIAHTDNHGSDAYNILLSQRRAKVVRNYLVSKGIESNRILFYGRGERIPRETNNTDEGRSYNRRTEFRVLGGIGNTPIKYSPEK